MVRRNRWRRSGRIASTIPTWIWAAWGNVCWVRYKAWTHLTYFRLKFGAKMKNSAERCSGVRVPLNTKERRWDETASGVKQWPAVCAIVPDHSAFCDPRCSPWERPFSTPNAVSSHLISLPLYSKNVEQWHSKKHSKILRMQSGKRPSTRDGPKLYAPPFCTKLRTFEILTSRKPSNQTQPDLAYPCA